jgi:AcrR family transcriptional regulator
VVTYAGQGDPRRSMALLWGASATPRRRGPKPALSVDEIVAAAIEVADRDGGLGKLSMQAVGDRLGRTAMALYTYVPSKEELLDLMYDRAHLELPTSYDLEPGWRPATTAWAGDLWTFYLRHPWVLQVSYGRPVLGPGEQGVAETLAIILEASDLEAQRRRHFLGVLFQFVRAAARTAAEGRLAAADTGESDEAWWQARVAALHEVAPDFNTRFPAFVRLSAAPSGPPDQEAHAVFRFGLDLLLKSA